MRTVHHVCSHFTERINQNKLLITGGDAESVRHFIIYLSKLLLFSLLKTTKFKAMRISSGEFTFRMGRGLLRAYP